jgi:arsenate reductase
MNSEVKATPSNSRFCLFIVDSVQVVYIAFIIHTFLIQTKEKLPVLTIYHNPRCSKSRQTLALITDSKCAHSIRLYLSEVPTIDELTTLQQQLGLTNVIEMMRVKEPEFAQAELSSTSSNDTLLAAIVAYPKLLERPIVSNGTQAVIGRPPENVNVLINLALNA